MANEKNLVPLDKRTKSEQREITHKGGKASGVARRRKRSMKEAADLFLSLSVTDTRKWNSLSAKGVDPEDIDNQMAIIVGMAKSAEKGNANAARVLIDMLGEEPEADVQSDDGFLDALRGEAAEVWRDEK